MAAEVISEAYNGAPVVDVSIVLAIYNESGHLEREIRRIQRAMEASSYSYEIVAVDDGSTDGSGELLSEMDGIRLLQFNTNRGTGSARKYGTLAARGRLVVWTDVDMSYPNDEIPELVAEIGGWDQVVGARRTEEGTHRLIRASAKWFIRKLAGYLTGTTIPDLNSGFRVFRRDVALQILHLLPQGFSCTTTMTMAFLSNSYSVRYHDIDYSPREGRSKFHWWRDTKRYLRQVIRLALGYQPLRVLMPSAVVLGILGAGKLVFDLIDKNFSVGTNTIVVLGASASVAIVAMLADVFVHLNKRRHYVIPATRPSSDQ